MKNTFEKAKFSFLVYQKNNNFIGICRETGYVEEGDSEDQVMHRLLNGTKAIYNTVKENPELLHSIKQRPPLKYWLLFYWIPIYYSFSNILHTHKVETFDLTPVELCG